MATNCEEFEFEFTSLETETLSCLKLMTEHPKSIYFMVQKRLREKHEKLDRTVTVVESFSCTSAEKEHIDNRQSEIKRH